jgi:retron-type reverse transcriptase
VGVWQPVTAEEICKIIKEVFREQFEEPKEKYVFQLCQKYTKEELLVRVRRNPSMYSLSQKGNESIPRQLRLSRDKKRLFLLRDVKRDLLERSHDEVYDELGDVSSLVETRFWTQGSEARSSASFVPTGQIFWLRFFQQFFKTGDQASSCDSFYPKFLSFYRVEQLPVARHIRQDDPNYLDAQKIDKLNLALMLGISHELITSILNHKKLYYRSFVIPKKSGEGRKIDGPRVFLKVIQRFLLDYYLSSLNVHTSVYSFTKSRSVFSNAELHQSKAFVGTIDIKNFFGSITTSMVKKILAKNNYDKSEADLIAELCTLKDILPQGAPTSPILSNALLYKFDECIDKFTKKLNLTYSRYADDLTISGDDKEAIICALKEAEVLLRENYSLNINNKKTRIVSFHNRQIVTGLVVNEKIQPPRSKRRQIRAAFHKALTEKKVTKEELNKLRGYYGYLSASPNLNGTRTLNRYKEILSDLSHNLVD